MPPLVFAMLNVFVDAVNVPPMEPLPIFVSRCDTAPEELHLTDAINIPSSKTSAQSRNALVEFSKLIVPVALFPICVISILTPLNALAVTPLGTENTPTANKNRVINSYI